MPVKALQLLRPIAAAPEHSPPAGSAPKRSGSPFSSVEVRLTNTVRKFQEESLQANMVGRVGEGWGGGQDWPEDRGFCS